MAIDRRVQRTRTALYDALVELIRERNYDTIRVEDILARADVGRSTFYTHFRSKDELLHRSLERLRAELMAVVEASPTPDLWTVSHTLFAHLHRYRDIHAALAGGSGGSILNEAIAANFARVVSALMPSTPRRELPRELAVRFVTSTLQTVLHWWLNRNPSLAPQAAAELFRKLVSTGLIADWPELGQD